MRTSLLAVALLLAACGRSDHTALPAATNASTSNTGPDLIALRLPRSGGTVRAYAVPRFDSVVWTSSAKVPPLDHVLGFDDEAGSVVAVDAKGAPVRVDLRLGDVTRDAAPKLTDLSTVDGSAVYGITGEGGVVRLTPAGSWTYKPPAPAHDIIPEPDGSLLVLNNTTAGATVWLLHPPETTIEDSAELPSVKRTIRTPVGDRVYFTVDSGLIGLRSRDLARVPSVRLDAHARAVVTTPSGDHLYVALDSVPRVLAVDRYRDRVDARIALPAPAAALRMDPTGRYVLARAADGDSVYVIAIGTDHVIGALTSEWRADLPTVLPSGWIATGRGNDLVLVDGETLRAKATVSGGAKDLWFFVGWNGFRPRAKGLDQPVVFDTDSSPPRDSTDSAAAPSPSDTAARPAPARDSTHPAVRDSAAASTAPAAGYTVQFAALRSEDAAKAVLQDIHVAGAQPRIVATERAGITIYRVVIGPFATREEATRIAKTSGSSYWVYEGAP